MRDKLDKALQSKLGNLSRQPPANMWERLERDLRAADAAAGVDRKRADAGREQGRRLFPAAARYAVAASLIAAVLVTAVIFMRHDQSGRIVVLTPAVTPVASEITENKIIPTTTAENITSGNNYRRILETQISDPVIKDTILINPGLAVEPQQSTEPPTAAPDNTARQSPPQRQVTTPKYSGSRSTPVLADNHHYNPISAKRNSGSSRNFSASLYAANFTGGGSGGKNGGKASWSGYQLTEVVSRASDSPVQTVYTSPPITTVNHRIPISAGLNFSFSVAPRVSLESGVTYTYLRSDWEADGYISNYDIRQELHYVGIPVAVIYNFASVKTFDFYLRAGGMIEKGVAGKRTTQLLSSSVSQTTDIKMHGIQPSLAASAGVQFAILPSFGLYVEPGINYYPAHDDQPESYRTQNNLTFNMRAGLRVSFGK